MKEYLIENDNLILLQLNFSFSLGNFIIHILMFWLCLESIASVGKTTRHQYLLLVHNIIVLLIDSVIGNPLSVSYLPKLPYLFSLSFEYFKLKYKL